MSERSHRQLSRAEFVALIACLTALDALSIDIMLPALTQISSDLNIVRENDRQFIITSLFSGFALGLLVYGVLGDSFGRKRPIVLGIVIFLVGTLLCTLAESLPTMIFGRAVQGFGASGPYVLAIAIVRDIYYGREMAKVMSFILMIFVAIPAIAPILGQGVLLLAGWRSIFAILALFALFVSFWFITRQPETLAPEKRTALSVAQIYRSTKEAICNRILLRFTLAQGCLFGAFLAFLSTAQQILQEHYGLGVKFPFYFAVLALTLGVASYFNSRWVHRLGLTRMVLRSLTLLVTTALIFLPLELIASDGLPFTWFMLYMMITYFCCGMLFGNITTLAMSPAGHIAGIASAIIGCIGTLMAMTLAVIIGSFYQGSVVPLLAGFLILGSTALLLVNSVKQYVKECPQ